jgi:hypothetical protein
MPMTVETGLTWHSGSHTMQPVFPGEATGDRPDSCTGCHTDLSREYMQRFVEETQSGILKRLTEAQGALEDATDVPPWVLDALQFVSNDGSLGIHNFSYASTLLDTAALELGVVQFTVPSNVSTQTNTASGRPRRTPMRRWWMRSRTSSPGADAPATV